MQTLFSTRQLKTKLLLIQRLPWAGSWGPGWCAGARCECWRAGWTQAGWRTAAPAPPPCPAPAPPPPLPCCSLRGFLFSVEFEITIQKPEDKQFNEKLERSRAIAQRVVRYADTSKLFYIPLLKFKWSAEALCVFKETPTWDLICLKLVKKNTCGII